MFYVFRQSTQRTIRVGSFVDAMDGRTPETGVTLGAADQAELMKAGGGASVDISGRTWAAVSGCDGFYDLTLTTSDTDTVGDIAVAIQDSSVFLPVWVNGVVLEEAAFDNLYASGAIGPLTAAAVQAECEDALETYRMNEMIVDVPATPPTVGAFFDNFINKSVSQTYNPATDSLEAQRDRLDQLLPDILSLANVLAQAKAAIEFYRLDEWIYAAASGNQAVDSFLDRQLNPSGGTPYDRNFGSQTAIAEVLTALPNRGDWSQVTVLASPASSTTTVYTTANEADDYHNGQELVVVKFSGGGASSARISDYAQTNGQFDLREPLAFAPSSGDVCYVRHARARASSAEVAAVEADTQDLQSRLPAALVGGRMDSDVGAVSGDSAAADNLEADYDGTGYAKTASTIGTATTLTGHTPQTGDNFARLGAPAGASVSADVAAVKTDTGNLVSRITAALFSGITSFAEWLGALAGKQNADATALSEIRSTGAGSGTYDPNDDAQEAIRDRGDVAWTSGSGGLTAQETRDAMKLAPTSGAPAAGSIDAHLDTIEEDTADMQPTVDTNLDVTVSSRAVAGDPMTLAANAITAAVIATDAIDADSVAEDVVTEINAAILSAIASLNNLSSAQAQAAAAAAIAADASIAAILYDARPAAADIDLTSGIMTLYADAGKTTPLATWQLSMDKAGTQPYDGTGAIHSRVRLT